MVVENEFTAGLAHPSALACGIAGDQRVIGHIFSHHCTGAYERIFTNGDPANDSGICPYSGAPAYLCAHEFGLAVHGAARIDYIGEYHAGTQEHIIGDFYAFVNRNIILHFHPVADGNMRGHKHILAKYAVFTNMAIRHQMRKMPHLGAITDVRAVVDDGGFVYESAC